MVRVIVSVHDYSTAEVKLHRIELEKGWQTDDVEELLRTELGYHVSEIEFMVSENDLTINLPDGGYLVIPVDPE